MDRDGLIPDIIDQVPEFKLDVSYSNVKVEMGNVLTPTQVKNIPTVTWKVAKVQNEVTYYTLVMIDPDAPSRMAPKFREWHHWLVGNIPGNNVESGEIISEYIGAGPPEGTDLHRYAFLLFKQNGLIKFDEPKLKNNSGKNRANFKVRKFAEKYNLGKPISGNYFKAKFDNYVPELYKQLSSARQLK